MTVARARATTAAILAMAAAITLAPTARAQGCAYIAEGTTWLFHADPPPAGWADVGTPDDPETTPWQLGCTPFSNTGCGFAPGTYWQAGTTLWLRQHVFLFGGETGLVASLAVDNDFDLHINGALVASLVKEGCATRWDATVPIPDSAWRAGDNVVAVRIVDRGGIANFEMRLDGPSPGTCPPGCAQAPCGEPGPVVDATRTIACAGTSVMLTATAAWARGCPGTMLYRFRSPAGAIVRDWDPSPDMPAVAGDGDFLVDARCGHSPACPAGQGVARAEALPFPPADPGASLRVNKTSAGLPKLSWPTAPPLLAGEHDHVLLSGDPRGPFVRANPEGDTTRSFVDPDGFGRACYLIRVADACEIESVDPR